MTASHAPTVHRFLIAAAICTAAIIGLLLVGASKAEAATDCCKVTYSADKKTMFIKGYVSYRGELLYMSVGGTKCLSRAGNQRAYIEAKVDTKYMPNGRHPISIVTKVDGQVKYSTQYFYITNSPAVFVDVVAPKGKVVKIDSPTVKLAKKGAIRSNACTIDGRKIGCGTREVPLSGLSEGRHVFKATVGGRDGFSWSDRKVFKVDTSPPTPPVVTGGGDWTNETVEVAASGSTDAGTGILRYEWRRSLDGGTTWGAINRTTNTYVDREGETLVAFRAVDRAGRVSQWVETTVRIDRTMPEGEPELTVTEGDPCTGSYPVTITAAGGTDALSGVGPYLFYVQERTNDDVYSNYEYWGSNVTLTNPTSTYWVDAWVADAAGNKASMSTNWSSDDCF